MLQPGVRFPVAECSCWGSNRGRAARVSCSSQLGNCDSLPASWIRATVALQRGAGLGSLCVRRRVQDTAVYTIVPLLRMGPAALAYPALCFLWPPSGRWLSVGAHHIQAPGSGFLSGIFPRPPPYAPAHAASPQSPRSILPPALSQCACACWQPTAFPLKLPERCCGIGPPTCQPVRLFVCVCSSTGARKVGLFPHPPSPATFQTKVRRPETITTSLPFPA